MIFVLMCTSDFNQGFELAACARRRSAYESFHGLWRIWA